MKREHQETIGGAGSSNGNKAESFSSSMATGKGKLWVEDDQDAGGMDELLAVLGYKIKSNLRSCRLFALGFLFLKKKEREAPEEMREQEVAGSGRDKERWR
ncbi:hypothetical protein SADUNF_Sadunf09G0077000 [Salix dunnii]|uniref:Uncharacterized protein n=1 Tax=Salix dunnii TaxID=1413687 RepID=A0A835JW41_9ROSI|nr:hypothetical protein SADUNF_Sadunf09G0077000 [Salix dunnii]